MKNKIAVFWFRRDLRLKDNVGLFHALKSGLKVLPIFIFDEQILSELPKNDARVTFIHESLQKIDEKLKKVGSSLLVLKGNPKDVWQQLLKDYTIEKVFANKDYEPYAIKRDLAIKALCESQNVVFSSYKDQVIFEENEVTKDDGLPYTVFTPYKKKWLVTYAQTKQVTFPSENYLENTFSHLVDFPTLESIGFEKSEQKVLPINEAVIPSYNENRDIPSKSTTNVSVYLRFGLISVRKLVHHAMKTNEVYTSELIWREFFMQVLWHFPKVINQNYREKYNYIPWRNNEDEFKLWCEGKTGYLLVDAGMRQLNKTGYMHNRVRMVVASFLCKHLMIDWRFGEAYFAQKLLDYELSANNGNWQWSAGTGCDAAPYYRVFNPITQLKKFDPNFEYVKQWIPNYQNYKVPKIIEHKEARERYLTAMKQQDS